jgi:hypothetical protein
MDLCDFCTEFTQWLAGPHWYWDPKLDETHEGDDTVREDSDSQFQEPKNYLLKDMNKTCRLCKMWMRSLREDQAMRNHNPDDGGYEIAPFTEVWMERSKRRARSDQYDYSNVDIYVPISLEGSKSHITFELAVWADEGKIGTAFPD